MFFHIEGCPCVAFKVQGTQSLIFFSLSVLVAPQSLNSLVSILSCLSCRMTRWAHIAPLLLGLLIHGAVSQDAEDPAVAPAQGQAADGSQTDEDNAEWAMNSIRGSFESVGGYFDSMLEFMGGRDGVCQYHCRYGKSVKWMSKYCLRLEE